MTHTEVQRIAKQTMAYIKSQIEPGMNLRQLRAVAETKMYELGADSFWYWDIGAFVFAGNETAVSVSGRHYKTSDKIIKENDIVTVDLSPQVGNIWGDYARTLILENGSVADDINKIKNTEWKNGLLTENKLHEELISFATPDTTFEQLYFYMNDFIRNCGYKNLDFMGNLGHSIATNKDDRIYIEKGNTATLSSVKFFTFEPHIAISKAEYGFKKENVYFFDNDKLVEL